MAYILGYIYADGSLEDASYLRGKYLRISSVDRQLIEDAKKVLGSEHKLLVIKPAIAARKTRYLLRIGSHRIYEDLIGLGLYPNKSLTITLPFIPGEFLSHFTRGYFDGDGCAFLEKAVGIKQKLIFKKMRIVFTSGSYIFLERLAFTLRERLDLKIDKVYKGNKSFQLAYSTADSVKLFRFMYATAEGLFLKRKFKKFVDFFQLRNNWLDPEIKKILKNNGHVVK